MQGVIEPAAKKEKEIIQNLGTIFAQFLKIDCFKSCALVSLNAQLEIQSLKVI